MPLIEKDSAKTYNVAVVVHDGVELLDFAGPGEVFVAASYHNGGSNVTFNVYTVAPKEGAIVSQRFLTIQPEFTIENCPTPDVLVIPGGRTNVLVSDAKFMSWAKKVTTKATTTLTVCTGAFVVGTNGQLDGLKATTHHSSIAGLRSSFPMTTVLEDQRFVDNGRIVTTAGVSAGIDGALHVVAKLANFSAAKETARYMEYDWTTADKTMALLPEAQRADAAQREKRNEGFAAAHGMIREKDWAAAITAFEKMTAAYPQDMESWYYLGVAHHNLGNFAEAIRANEQAAKLKGYVAHRPIYNIACSYARIGRNEYALNALEHAVRLGMTNASHIEKDTDLDGLRAEARYKKLIESLRD